MGSTQTRHLVTRGNSYHYVRRVPRDLSHHFPTPTIWKPLKAKTVKEARLLADGEEYRTEQLFLHLTTGMLSADIEKQMVTAYLRKGVEILELKAAGRTVAVGNGAAHKSRGAAPTSPPLAGEGQGGVEVLPIHQTTYKNFFSVIDANFDSPPPGTSSTAEELLETNAALKERLAAKTKEMIATRKTFSVAEDIAEVATFLKKKYNVKLTEEDTRALSLKFMNVDKLLLESETAMLQGDWSPMERLREKVEQEHVAPF